MPRAELSALVWHLHAALVPALYVGDCKAVIDGALHGVPSKLQGAESLHADLWRQVARLCADHGPGLKVCKAKAHRSKQEAESSVDDPTWHWAGNRAVEAKARMLCKQIAFDDCAWSEHCRANGESLQWLLHIIVAAEWCFRHWPAGRRQRHVSHPRGQWRSLLLGGHDLCKRPNGGWRCVVCLAHSRSDCGLAAPRRKPCLGTLRRRVHPSHCAAESHGFVWCSRCGAHARRVPRVLLRPCVGAPRSQSYGSALRRLRGGLPPVV